MVKWTAVLTNLAYKPLNEPRTTKSLSYSRALNKLATCSFQIALDDPLSPTLSTTAAFVKLYRGTSLRYFGPIVTAEETIDRESKSLAITSADGWILQKRLAGKSATGQVFSTATDLAQIAKSLIDTTNTMAETGISTTTVTMSAASARTYTAGPYRFILEIVQELGSALDGFDWRLVPIENWVNGAVSGTKFAYMHAVPVIGSNQPTAIFEYGLNTRSNVLNYTKTTSRDGQANLVFLAGADYVSPVSDSDPSAQGTWGVQEDILTMGDLTDATMRAQIAAEHIIVRSRPRTLIKLTPHIDPGVTGRLPQPFVDYDIGDTITARIVDNGLVKFAGLLRVYGINVSIDEQGFERIELVTEDEA
jgi:hypothetical protein